MPVQVSNVKQALKVIGNIFETDSKGAAIEGFPDRVQAFYTTAAKWCSEIVTKWKAAIATKNS